MLRPLHSPLAPPRTPEEEELLAKRAELAALEDQLVQRELERATLQAELHAFQADYLRAVGRKYADLDDLEAQIAAAAARKNPRDLAAHHRAEEAHAQAEQTRHAAAEPAGAAGPPSDELKRLYRQVARLIHPDLANDEPDRLRRDEVMKQVNLAYERGDEEALRQILLQWQASPDAVEGGDVPAQLVRVIRKIAQVRRRLAEVGQQIERLRSCDSWQFKEQVAQAREAGRDLLSELAAELDTRIHAARRRLQEISTGHEP
jgi:hypothetical protein